MSGCGYKAVEFNCGTSSCWVLSAKGAVGVSGYAHGGVGQSLGS
jgi:hypothetical protein